MVQMPPAATATVQVLDCANGPVTAIEVKLSGAEPLLVTATVCAALVVFTAWEPKLRLRRRKGHERLGRSRSRKQNNLGAVGCVIRQGQ